MTFDCFQVASSCILPSIMCTPEPSEVEFARRVIEAIPDGRGVHMIDGKMQDDATWKQCRVMVDLAEMLARKDPELAEAYDMAATGAGA